ncbi:hypothetical protein [Apibacter sp.]|uniref:hypothetical protein n=1 Tax=Apibacter sp. TaxID=2023709 RepID=UPI0025E5D4E1|nr:hypothetical protein [Apibacter sp.]MCT6868730.1 hypothetical protein [Apibacter sp.]
MKKIILGTFLGAAIGYIARKMQEDGFFDQVSNELNKFTSKTKKNLNNMVDVGKNEAEYLKDRAKKYGEKGESLIQED